MKIKCKVNYEDARGEIRDIFFSSPKEHCTIITFAPHVSRANHYHKKTFQYTYVIEGNLTMASCEINDREKFITDVKYEKIEKGDYIEHPPYHVHGFKSESNATIIVFSNGIRGGTNYEKDVFRLKTPLI